MYKWPIANSQRRLLKQPLWNQLYVVWSMRISDKSWDRPISLTSAKSAGLYKGPGAFHWEIFWILTLKAPFSWFSESFRQDIGQLDSLPMKSWKWFSRLKSHSVTNAWTLEKKTHLSKFSREVFSNKNILITESLIDFLKMVEPVRICACDKINNPRW